MRAWPALAVCWLALAGCARKQPSEPPPKPAPRVEDARCPTPFTGVTVVPFWGSADPASLSWNESKRHLLIADNVDNRIWKWSDAGGLSVAGRTSGEPADPTGAGRDEVGQLVEYEGGTIRVPRFGFGTHGSILALQPDGTRASLRGIDPTRRRIGMVSTDAGTFTTTFTTSDAGSIGTVNKLGSGEREWAGGFRKPVGIVQVGDELIVADQERGALLAVKLLQPSDALREVAIVPVPDLLSHGPSGTFFTGQYSGKAGEMSVRQICRDGSYGVFDSPLRRPTGVAYDARGKRVFVTDGDGESPAVLRIYQL
jgi:hypothetical protein